MRISGAGTKKRIDAKRGSATVFIMIFMVSFVSMISVFINGSRNAAIEGSVESLGRLWASSILGEYDRNLYERFGLMGFYGTEDDISGKLDTYAECSFEGKSYIDAGECSARLYDHYLTLFITLMDSDVKYLRMMDLVQIDMQYGYYSEFFLKDYYTGLSYTIEVNGKDHEFGDEY